MSQAAIDKRPIPAEAEMFRAETGKEIILVRGTPYFLDPIAPGGWHGVYRQLQLTDVYSTKRWATDLFRGDIGSLRGRDVQRVGPTLLIGDERFSQVSVPSGEKPRPFYFRIPDRVPRYGSDGEAEQRNELDEPLTLILSDSSRERFIYYGPTSLRSESPLHSNRLFVGDYLLMEAPPTLSTGRKSDGGSLEINTTEGTFVMPSPFDIPNTPTWNGSPFEIIDYGVTAAGLVRMEGFNRIALNAVELAERAHVID